MKIISIGRKSKSERKSLSKETWPTKYTLYISPRKSFIGKFNLQSGFSTKLCFPLSQTVVNTEEEGLKTRRPVCKLRIREH